VGYHPVAVMLQLHYSVHHSTANNKEETHSKRKHIKKKTLKPLQKGNTLKKNKGA
jgi:hypothetical protein